MSNVRLYQLQHCAFSCEHHIVWAPKWRVKVLTDKYIKQELKYIFAQIARWKGFEILGWHIADDHIHLIMMIPPKYSVSYTLQILKGKFSAWIKKKTKRFPQGSLGKDILQFQL